MPCTCQVTRGGKVIYIPHHPLLFIPLLLFLLLLLHNQFASTGASAYFSSRRHKKRQKAISILRLAPSLHSIQLPLKKDLFISLSPCPPFGREWRWEAQRPPLAVSQTRSVSTCVWDWCRFNQVQGDGGQFDWVELLPNYWSVQFKIVLPTQDWSWVSTVADIICCTTSFEGPPTKRTTKPLEGVFKPGQKVYSIARNQYI